MTDDFVKDPAATPLPDNSKGSAEGAPPEKSGDIPWAVVLIMIMGGFMAILDGSIVNVALPKLMSIFGVGTEDIQWQEW